MEMEAWVLPLLLSLHYASAQVGYDIYSEEDLLALDSQQSINEVSVAPPPGFLDSLSKKNLPVASNPVQKTGLARGDTTLSYNNNVRKDGSYSFGYSTSGGLSRQEAGSVTQSGYRVEGSYSYLGGDGVTYTVVFVADENGYRPKVSRQPGPLKRQGRIIRRPRKTSISDTDTSVYVTRRPRRRPRRVRRPRSYREE